MVLALLLPRPPYCLLPLPGELVLFFFFFSQFFFPGGGRRGRRGIKDSVPERGRGEIGEGAGAGKATVVPSQGGVVWGQALNIVLLENLSGEKKSRGAKEGATRARGRTRDGILRCQGKWGDPGTRGASWGWGECSHSVSPVPLHPSSSPGLLFSSLSPTTEAVALAMSSCSCVPCMFPTLHPPPFARTPLQ